MLQGDRQGLSFSRASRRDGVFLNRNGVNRCAVAFGRHSSLYVCLSVLSSGSRLLVRNEPGHVQARQRRNRVLPVEFFGHLMTLASHKLQCTELYYFGTFLKSDDI